MGPGRESPNDLHSISIDRLNEQVAALKAAGFVPMTLPSAFDVLTHARRHQPGFVLTFDDGYASLLTYARELRVEAAPCVFILTDYAGRSTATWNTRSSVVLEHLDVDGICALRDRGFDIQLHGSDHHNLLKFDDEELRRRFRKTTDWFRARLGQPPDYLAYPYGYCDRRIQAVAVSER